MDNIHILKFGGTSVSAPEVRAQAIAQVLRKRALGKAVVVVVSAMGRSGAPYATDTLLGLFGDSQPTGHVKDLLASCGETISACLFANDLVQKGCPAEPLTGTQAGIITDDCFTQANIRDMDTTKVMLLLEQGIIPVITGFQGKTVRGDVTTLGRGGSDTSAVEIGGLLGAEEIHIFTDVPGIAKVDPRLYPDTEWISHINYDDMLLLSSWGAGVIHPRAVEAAKRYSVPTYVRSTFSDSGGTRIDSACTDIHGLIGMAVIKDSAMDGGIVVKEDGSSVISILCRSQIPLDMNEVLQGVCEFKCYAEADSFYHVVTASSYLADTITAIYKKVSPEGQN